MATDTTPNPLEMSDDEILNMSSPPVVEEKAVVTDEDTTTNNDQAKIDEVADQGGSGDGSVETKTDTADTNDEDKSKEAEDNKNKEEEDLSKLTDEEILARDKAEPKKPEEKPEDKAAEAGKVEEKTEDKSKTTDNSENKDKTDDKSEEDKSSEEVKEPDYKAVYEEIMKPFKANGKTIELRDPKEVIKLMQMGANYTRRMQELTPHRKTLMMLESNGITQDKLSFLIDLEKKNPEAIKKLIKDSGIDPMDIDTSSEAAYTPGNHQVADEEVNFKTVLDELASTPEGVETLSDINKTWDDTSKDALWKSPEIMQVINEHRSSGVYDAVKNEVDRRITLGLIPTNTPFLQAYKTVGDEMAEIALKAGNQGNTGQDTGTATATTKGSEGQSQGGQVVATRAATVKPAVKDNDKAAAASVTRSSPAKADVPQKNPLAMADEEFLKQMNGRL